ncbi:MAG: hypothetical protein AAFR04_14360 [Pseudomonadota bacterium]
MSMTLITTRTWLMGHRRALLTLAAASTLTAFSINAALGAAGANRSCSVFAGSCAKNPDGRFCNACKAAGRNDCDTPCSQNTAAPRPTVAPRYNDQPAPEARPATPDAIPGDADPPARQDTPRRAAPLAPVRPTVPPTNEAQACPRQLRAYRVQIKKLNRSLARHDKVRAGADEALLQFIKGAENCRQSEGLGRHLKEVSARNVGPIERTVKGHMKCLDELRSTAVSRKIVHPGSESMLNRLVKIDTYRIDLIRMEARSGVLARRLADLNKRLKSKIDLCRF